MSTFLMTSILYNSLKLPVIAYPTVKKEELSKKIGKRIVELREKKGLTQSDLARACIKDRQAIDRIERGKTNPNLFTLYEITSALEVSLAELFSKI